jgi:hypothetical protein
MDVTNIENVNISWEAYSTPAFDLTDVSNATVNLLATKTGFLGNANFTEVGENNISVGTGITGVVKIDGIEDASITATVAKTLTVGSTTPADGLVTIDAGAAKTVTVVGGDELVVTALSATSVSLTTAFDSADLTLGVDSTVVLDGASDAQATIRSDADIAVELTAALELEQITLDGDGEITLDFADSPDISGVKIVNGKAIILAGAAGTPLDLDEVEHTSITFETAFAADSTITAATNSDFVFETNAAADELDIVLTADNDTSGDAITLTFEVSQTATIDTAVSTTTDFETLNLVFDGTADLTADKIAAGTGTVNISSNDDYDVTVGSIAAGTVDASTMTTDLTLTQTAAAAMSVILGSGTNDINLVGTTHDSSVIGDSGDDDVSFLTTTGTAAALLGNGDNTVSAAALTSGGLSVIVGSGDDTVTVDSLTFGEVRLTLGNGDNTVNFDPGTLAGATLSVLAGTGDDTFNFDSAAAVATVAADNISIDLGLGSNTVSFSGGASTIDLTAGTVSFSNVDILAFGGQATNVTLDAALLNGASFTLKGDGTLTDRVVVEVDVAGAYDFSTLGIDGTNAKAFGGLNITGSSGNDTITGSEGTDLINTGNGTVIPPFLTAV